jgi:serine O-acetyltransferase
MGTPVNAAEGRVARLMGLWAQLRADLAWYKIEGGPRSAWAAFGCRNFWIVATYRIGHWARFIRLPVVGQALRFGYQCLNFVVSTITNADIRPGARIGQRFSVHTCRGLLITNGVVIGDDCMVNAQVCIVNQGNDKQAGVPKLGNDVRIGVGGKVMGGITIGDHVRVGANAVVIRDVPENHLAVGVPAVLKPRRAAASAGENSQH